MVHRDGRQLMTEARTSYDERHGHAMLVVATVALATLIGCETSSHPVSSGTGNPMAKSARPTFTVHDVFYIAPPIDSVIATGVVDVGTFRVGDSVVIADGLRSQIGKIESIRQGEIPEAGSGDNVGFHLIGVRRDQIKSGARIFVNN
jgi:translation elongation factor EF-Tu-like GTPase